MDERSNSEFRTKTLIKKSLFIFRRDLRVEDNTGLIYALKHSEEVIPCFIFTPEQIEHNPYRSDHCLQFMIESLQDLDKELRIKKGKLYLFYGIAEEVIEQCIQKVQVESVIVNRDYTPFSQARDKKIATICKKHRVDFLIFDDSLLHPPEDTLKKDGTPYKIFTPYYRQVSRYDVALPKANDYSNYFTGAIDFSCPTKIFSKILPKHSPRIAVHGGRSAVLKIVKQIGTFSNYASDRDYPALHSTTLLSAYLKFTIRSTPMPGTCASLVTHDLRRIFPSFHHLAIN